MPEYPVQLGGSSSNGYGSVQVFHENTWGSVCGTLTDQDAATICRTLGFSGGEVDGSIQSGNAVSTTSPVWLQGLSCTGNETSIWDCSLPAFGAHECQGHSNDAQAIRCIGKWHHYAACSWKNLIYVCIFCSMGMRVGMESIPGVGTSLCGRIGSNVDLCHSIGMSYDSGVDA